MDRDHAYVCDARREAKVTLGKSVSSGLVIGHLSHPSGRQLGLSQKTYPAFSNVQRLDYLSQREMQIMDQEEGIKCPSSRIVGRKILQSRGIANMGRGRGGKQRT